MVEVAAGAGDDSQPGGRSPERWYLYLSSPADAGRLDGLPGLLRSRDLFSQLSGARYGLRQTASCGRHAGRAVITLQSDLLVSWPRAPCSWRSPGAPARLTERPAQASLARSSRTCTAS